MKTKKLLSLLFVLVLVVGACALAGCGSKDAETYGDKYKTLIESGEARDYAGYEEMKAELDKIREESGAEYVYMMSPSKDGKPSLDGDITKSGSFVITVDGSVDPDDWGVDYGWEKQFEEAWNGTPAAARSAWENGTETAELCWSGFAPVYDSEGVVVGILGIDYPADVVVDYPEWNRDSAKWNHMEEEITVEVPADVQNKIDEVTKLAEKYAKQLSE